MHPLVTLLLTVGATLGSAALVLLVVLAVRRRSRRARAQVEAAAERRAQARADEQIARLDARVSELSADVAEARAATARRDTVAQDYVITTLLEPDDARPGAARVAADDAVRRRGDDERSQDLAVAPSSGAFSRTARTAGPAQVLAAAVETHVVAALARQQGVSAIRDRAVDLGVQGVALAHGVRRALSAETLDRAAAEAHVARRRSRRVRRAEVREARRLVRHLRSGDGGPVTVRAVRPSRAQDVA